MIDIEKRCSVVESSLVKKRLPEIFCKCITYFEAFRKIINQLRKSLRFIRQRLCLCENLMFEIHYYSIQNL